MTNVAEEILRLGPRILRAYGALVGTGSTVDGAQIGRADGDAYDLLAADMTFCAQANAGVPLERQDVAMALAGAVEVACDDQINRGFPNASREDVALAAGLVSLATRETTDTIPRAELARDVYEARTDGLVGAALAAVAFSVDFRGRDVHEWCPVEAAEIGQAAGIVFGAICDVCDARPAVMLEALESFGNRLDLAAQNAKAHHEREGGREQALPVSG